MLVEDAERYGISQLHQLRGRDRPRRPRVGVHPVRAQGVGAPDGAREHADGFRLAEIDLELRREGELIGTRQSGWREFAVARLPEDEPLLERARDVAGRLMAEDPDLRTEEHALLADWLRERFGAAELDLPIPA